MKNRLPYIIGALALVALILLVIGAPRENEQKFDERISLRQKDKIPYGTYAAQQLLSSLFPDAAISTDKAGQYKERLVVRGAGKLEQVIAVGGILLVPDQVARCHHR